MIENKIDDLQMRHQALILEIGSAAERVDISVIRNFLDELAQAGSEVQDSESRAYLRSLIRYWASYIGDRTGNMPIINLLPFSGISAPSAEPPSSPGESKSAEINQRIGQYLLDQEIGSGGFSVVYHAIDTLKNEEVAVKVFKNENIKDPQFYEKLSSNEQTVRDLNHPNVIRVKDFGKEGKNTFIVMEYISGGSLSDRMKQWFWQPTLREVILLTQQIANGLAYIHDHGIIHRDIKPGNILIDYQNRPYITDFGIARIIEHTQFGLVVGTPAYMSPETIRHPDQVDKRTDLYSLGIIMYELLTGRPLFLRSTPEETMRAQIEFIPFPLEVQTPVPKDVSEFVQRCLEKDPQKRPQNAQDFSVYLDLLLNQVPPNILNTRFGGFVSAPEARPVVPPAEEHHTEAFYDKKYGSQTDSPHISDSKVLFRDSRPLLPLSSPAYSTPVPVFQPPSTVTSRETLMDTEIISEEDSHQNMPVSILIVHSEDGYGSSFVLKPERYVIGRSPLCSIQINDPTVSKQHVLFLYCPEDIEKFGSPFKLIDLASGNGLIVNNEKVNEIYLNHNDVIRIGRTEFLFKRLDIDNQTE